ncbi:MAG: hypothetical protein AB2809_07400 [Candidatus Thiodiazotropha sp.]
MDIDLITKYCSSPKNRIRIFLVKADLDHRNDSWTYDPLEDSANTAVWGGAIFITELFNDNSDERYVDMGYLPTNDSLLHEIGHVLLQDKRHYNGPKNNFFHAKSEMTDDTIHSSQIKIMRKTLMRESYGYQILT